MRTILFRAVALAAGTMVASAAQAHGILGQRFFPATISSDDPFAADELALPTISHFDHQTDTDFDYSKSIFPGFALGIGAGYVESRPPGGPKASGLGNLDLSSTLELVRDPDHEFIFSAGLDWEIGGSGGKQVADSGSTYAPTLKYGKGMGDLPDSLALLRPLAITGTVGYALPGKSVEWAGAVEYSLLYLQNNVRDQGFSRFVAHLTPVVEYAFSTSPGGTTTGTVHPGLIWSGQEEQLAVEAIIPVDRASGSGVGVIAQLHFYLDDIFPHSLGTPLIGGNR